mmetsp:Transcript_21796/g.35012  ORF Transcript_21796/g.35012 Transcript_21796/m.35012 type:complete len:733 (+) Transcript_21796:210-2408(+)
MLFPGKSASAEKTQVQHRGTVLHASEACVSSLLDTAMSDVECVQVVVRCRPLNQKEIQNGCKPVVSVDESSGEVNVAVAQKKSGNCKLFTFDKVFGENATQQMIYDTTANAITKSVMDGYNGTIFAYGQTGTGKTHTMVGSAANNNNDNDTSVGIIPRAFKQIFDEMDTDFLVRCSFIEIYNDCINDLLTQSKDSLELREHPEKGVFVKDLCYKECKNNDDLLKHFHIGNQYRHTGETAMNRDSSRSHCIFTIIVESMKEDNIRVGKLHLVDLAGSERQSKTHAKGVRFTEAVNINLSLSALGNVINALAASTAAGTGAASHIPYRDSKLTRILQDSLGGNSKTLMIANICSADYNCDESLSTLRFANRAKNIQNKPHINQDPKDKLLEQYKLQIEEMKRKLAARQSGVHVDENDNMDDIEEQIIPKIIIQKVHKIGVSKERVRRMHEQQLKEEQRLKQQFEREKQEWQKETKGYLSQKIKTEKKVQYIETQVLLKQQAKKESLRQKLFDIERKLVDGEKMIHSAVKQESELQSKKQMLAEIKRKEEHLRSDFLEKQQKHLLLKEKYDSREQELKDKKYKLRKLYEKYKTMSHNIESLQSTFQNKREEYLNIIRILNKKIKLKNVMIEYFVEPNQLQRLYQSDRIVLKESADTEPHEIDKVYAIRKVDVQQLNNSIEQPRSCKPASRIKPVAEWNRIQCVLLQNENTRYRYENVMQLPLDMPQRTTQDYYDL